MKPTHAKPQSGRAIEPSLALYIVSKRGHPVGFGQTGLLFANRQWGTIVLYSGTGKIILPISAKVYVIVLQHYGSTPQYNGVDITQNVSSSLKDQEEIRFIAITK